MNEYVLKVTEVKQNGAEWWEASVALSHLRNNPVKRGTPLCVYTMKSATFAGDTRDEAMNYAKNWAEEQAL